MNFSQLRCFVALAKSGSFVEAAEEVHLTQSAVSRALLTLESELGVTLFERNRRGIVALTAVGREILPRVRSILSQVEAIEQEARAAQGEMSGRLRVSSIASLVPGGLLAGVITRFRRLYPDIDVALFEGAMHEVGEWLDQGIVDVSFVIFPAPGIECTPLTQDELRVILPATHRLKGRSAVLPEDLAGEGLILEKTHCALTLLQGLGLTTEGKTFDVRYQASDSATILSMVREGLGVAILPRQMLPARLEGIVALPFDPPMTMPLSLAVKSETASKAAKLFIHTAVEWIEEKGLHEEALSRSLAQLSSTIV